MFVSTTNPGAYSSDHTFNKVQGEYEASGCNSCCVGCRSVPTGVPGWYLVTSSRSVSSCGERIFSVCSLSLFRIDNQLRKTPKLCLGQLVPKILKGTLAGEAVPQLQAGKREGSITIEACRFTRNTVHVRISCQERRSLASFLVGNRLHCVLLNIAHARNHLDASGMYHLSSQDVSERTAFLFQI